MDWKFALIGAAIAFLTKLIPSPSIDPPCEREGGHAEAPGKSTSASSPVTIFAPESDPTTVLGKHLDLHEVQP